MEKSQRNKKCPSCFDCGSQHHVYKCDGCSSYRCDKYLPRFMYVHSMLDKKFHYRCLCWECVQLEDIGRYEALLKYIKSLHKTESVRQCGRCFQVKSSRNAIWPCYNCSYGEYWICEECSNGPPSLCIIPNEAQIVDSAGERDVEYHVICPRCRNENQVLEWHAFGGARIRSALAEYIVSQKINEIK